MTLSRSTRIALRLRHALRAFRVYRSPVVRFLDYFGLLKARQVDVTLQNGLRFRIRSRTGDFAIIDEVFNYGVYDRALDTLKPGHIVLDIGAHVGVFALAAAMRGATVNCFEPLPDNFELLVANAKLNGYESRINAWPSAVAAQAGTMEMFTVVGDTGGSTFFPTIHPEWSHNVGVATLSVSCTTLHDILSQQDQRSCDCLKMDCEGAEFEILQRAEPGDLKRVGAIILEYHPVTDVHQIRTRLEQIGFIVDVSENPCILYASRSRQC